MSDLLHLSKGVEFRIHWFAVTVHADFVFALTLLQSSFSHLIPPGGLREKGHGARGYKQIDEGLSGLKIYSDYKEEDELEASFGHCHIEMPGDCCDASTSNNFVALLSELIGSGVRFKITRLDFAFDGGEFSPEQAYDLAVRGHLRTVANRSSINIIQSPFGVCENGRVGSSTFYLGSKSSLRRLRIYDERGFTRTELQLRDDWSDKVGRAVLSQSSPVQVAVMAMGSLRDFVDFFAEWWQKFTVAVPRAMVRAFKNARGVAMFKMQEWIVWQVAPTLAAIERCAPQLLAQWIRQARPSRRVINLFPDGDTLGRVRRAARREAEGLHRERLLRRFDARLAPL